MWHVCEPFRTVAPGFLVTGVLAMVVALVVLIWAAAVSTPRGLRPSPGSEGRSESVCRK